MRLEIKRLERKRLILNWIEAILYAAFIIFCIWVVATYQPKEQEGQVIEHTVKTGENLTSICNKYYKDTYILKSLAIVKNDNNIIESDLYVGQVLKIRKDI